MLRRRDPDTVRIATRAQTAAAWWEPGLAADKLRTRRKTHYTAFSVWAPAVLNKVDKSADAVFDRMPWYPEKWEGGPPADHSRPPEAQAEWIPDATDAHRGLRAVVRRGERRE